MVCDTFCATIELLNAHEKEKHSLFAYKCGDCSKVFNSQSAFKEHEKYHSGYKQCPACDKKFLNDDRYVECQTQGNIIELRYIIYFTIVSGGDARLYYLLEYILVSGKLRARKIVSLTSQVNSCYLNMF